MKNSKYYIFGLALVLGAAPRMVVAQEGAPQQVQRRPGAFQNHADPGAGERKMPRRGGGHDIGLIAKLLANENFAQAIDLSESQREALETLMTSQNSKREALHEQHKAALMAQAKLLTDPEVDEEAVMAAVERTGAIRTELAKLEVISLISCRKTLTSEQLKKVRMHVEQHRPNRDRRNRTGQPYPQDKQHRQGKDRPHPDERPQGPDIDE